MYFPPLLDLSPTHNHSQKTNKRLWRWREGKPARGLGTRTMTQRGVPWVFLAYHIPLDTELSRRWSRRNAKRGWLKKKSPYSVKEPRKEEHSKQKTLMFSVKHYGTNIMVHNVLCHHCTSEKNTHTEQELWSAPTVTAKAKEGPSTFVLTRL